MSVINKMLRDLDRRQADGATPVQSWESRTGMARDTSKMDYAVRADREPKTTSSAVLVAVLLTALVFSAVAGAWWYLTQNQPVPRPVDPVKQVPVAPAAPAAAPAPAAPVAVAPVVPAPAVPAPAVPVAVAPVVPAPAVPVAVAPVVPAPAAPVAVAPVVPAPAAPVAIAPVPAMPPKIVPQSPTQAAPPALPAAAAKLPKVEPVVRADPPWPTAAKPPAVAQRMVNGTPRVAEARAEEPSNPSRPAAAGLDVPPIPSRPAPAMEALAQVQRLWSTGAQQEAIDLAREALVAAERTSLATPSAENKSILASLARELARMEMAQGRVRQALEMLTRLEPALFANADVWAMRGNAAQRLGRHEESVTAYVMALKLRPNEARWMLAAAISLANQGQMADAAELTERARVGGVLTPEVTAYLKQLGVPMRER